jgi:hypothetical protein
MHAVAGRPVESLTRGRGNRRRDKEHLVAPRGSAALAGRPASLSVAHPVS